MPKKPEQKVVITGPSVDSPLVEAIRLTTGDRRDAYGHPRENFADIADGWNTLVRREGGTITPRGTARMMIWLKLVRDANRPGEDNLVDIAGYVNTAAMLEEEAEDA